MSTLHALLFFGGIPLLVIVIVYVIAFAPSWTGGPGARLSHREWTAEPEWFGGPEAVEPSGSHVQRQLTTQDVEKQPGEGDQPPPGPKPEAGGASARW